MQAIKFPMNMSKIRKLLGQNISVTDDLIQIVEEGGEGNHPIILKRINDTKISAEFC